MRKNTKLLAALALLAAGSVLAQDSPTNAKIEDIVETPATYVGKNVLVDGEVDDVLSNRAFTLEGGFLGIGRDLMVLASQPLDAIKVEGDRWTLEDDEVTVTGVVRTATVAELEREIGWDLMPEVEAEIENKPVLIASAVRVTDADD